MSERHRPDLHQANRRSWNAATRAHNLHKRDQAGWLRAGGELLFAEDHALLGDLPDRRLLHLQCNSGQDSLCLARRGAQVTGVDISDEAIEFARALSADSGIVAQFEHADLYDWLPMAAAAGRRFDLIYSSYGALCWLSDLDGWARGIAGVLAPGGALVLVEFHPLALCFDPGPGPRRLHDVAYFGAGQGRVQTWDEGVGDYVGATGDALAPMGYRELDEPYANPHPCHEFAWTIADILGAVRRAGLLLEHFEEHAHVNGYRMFEDLEAAGDRRWRFPEGAPDLPLMFSLRARAQAAGPAAVSLGSGMSMTQVDAFCDRPFAGNPAAVCLLDPPNAGADDARLQGIAAENNLSETAFVRRLAPGRWQIRWFTPTVEVDLCGHASLAAGHVVLTQIEPERDAVVFESRSGPLAVRRDRERPGLLSLDLPADPPRPLAPAPGLLAALGLAARGETPRAASLGLSAEGGVAETCSGPTTAAFRLLPLGENPGARRHVGFHHGLLDEASVVAVLRGAYWLVIVDDAARVRALAPDMRGLAGIPPGEVIVSAAADPSDGIDFVSRFFAPGVGIDEDPVTGSAHCILAPYWAARLGKDRLRARQLSARGGDLECCLRGDRVELIGACVTVMTATLLV